MSLSSDLISQFVKITNDVEKTVPDKTLYGTAVEYDNSVWVKIDGSEQLTPIKSTTTIKPGDRVMVEIANHSAIVTGNLSSPSARQEDVDDEIDRIGNTITDFEIVIAGKVDTIEFNAEVARIEELRTDNVLIKKNLTAAEANIKVLEADYVQINEKLIADEAEIDNLKTTKLDASIADITYATIEDLEATNIDVNNLEATYADIHSLIFGSATGTTIHTSFANAVIAQLGDAQIKSAMIDEVSASKITAGDIITNNVRVMSQDGSLIISDETIQISDEARVRVQIGKDATNDYSINIWDADGNLMFSEGGITDSAIKDAIIRNDMVASDANISASKLDISSLFEEINDSDKTINAGRIYMDADNQTLDVAFKQMTTDVEGLQNSVTTQGTELSVIQGQIESKIWLQDIDIDTDELANSIETLNTKYSELEQNLDGISSTVYSYSSQIVEAKEAAEDAQNAVEGMVIGGRNLAGNTSSIWTDITVGELTGEIQHTINDETSYIHHYADYGIGVDDYITFSVDINAINKDLCLRLELVSDTLHTQSIYKLGDVIPAGSSGRSTITTLPNVEYPYFAVYIGADGTVKETTNEQYKCLKIERGNKATDWSPAPEDVDADIADVGVKIVEESSSVRQSTSELILEATKSLVTEDEFGTYQEEISSKFEQTTDQITMSFKSATEQIKDVGENVNVIRRNLQKYFEFSENGLTIKAGENTMSLTIDNDIIVFKKNGKEFGWWDGVDFHTGNIYIEVTKRAQFGKYAFVPRSDGSLMLLKVE